ncbi:MAG: primase C-terminal domain-containing protein [Flavobacteriales bacterium]|nr:primase C-terminal domain-containing protein [Flavobacteriales bacterium]
MTITDIINFTNKKVPFVPGNRNNYTFLLACNLNRAGIDKNSATGEITRLFSESDFKEEEIRKILNSAYANSIEHGKYKYESSFGQIKETISVDDQNLCLKELKRNNLEPKEATMARLAIWALKEEKGLVIGSLREDATLIESTISDCSDGKLLKYICVQDQEIDWDDLSEHEDEEIRGCFNAHHSCISDCDSIPDDLLMVTIVHFKLGKLTEAYNKLIHQAFFVPRVKAEIYHDRLSKMAQINNAWKSTYDALALNYLESHRS